MPGYPFVSRILHASPKHGAYALTIMSYQACDTREQVLHSCRQTVCHLLADGTVLPIVLRILLFMLP